MTLEQTISPEGLSQKVAEFAMPETASNSPDAEVLAPATDQLDLFGRDAA